jgi:hypothetical protein
MKLYFSIVFALLFAVYALNARLDVAGIQTYGTVYELTTRQGPSDLLVWPNLFDQRAWLKAKLEQKGCPERLILGSSTVGALRQDWFPERPFVNGWMGAPTIEDFEATTAILERTDCKPAKILLGVDHWFVNGNFNDKRWTSIAGDFASYQLRRGRPWLAARALARYWDTFKERLSFVATRESFVYLVKSAREHSWRTPPKLIAATPDEFCRTISSVYYIRSYDGHYTTCPVFASSAAAVHATATAYVAANGHQVRQWEQVDDQRIARLRQVVRTLRRRGSAVTLLAPPFHPITYRNLMADDHIRENFRALDSLLTALALEESASFVNLRDPASVGCGEDEFEDSHHGRPACARKVAERLARPH